MHYCDWTSGISDLGSPAWLLCYATVDVPLARVLDAVSVRYPGVPVFGCTSFRGVFSPRGFTRGFHVLGAQPLEDIRAAAAYRSVGATRAQVSAREAAAELRAALGAVPDVILMHATPGFEERVLEGVEQAFEGDTPPVYGGSAADDELRGDWQVFCGTETTSEGFVLAGFSSRQAVYGSFISGYAPTNIRGTVTAARGRIVERIDDRPAAVVYNEWTNGAIRQELRGGVVLATTTLSPLGRIIDEVGAMPRYVLSHPHEVLPDGALALFTDVRVGDKLVLMQGNEAALLQRTTQVVTRALAGAEPRHSFAGAVLLYCGGCVGTIGSDAADVAAMFHHQVHGAPFIGAATFGEQGCFQGPSQSVNRHGNLMCDAVLFGE